MGKQGRRRAGCFTAAADTVVCGASCAGSGQGHTDRAVRANTNAGSSDSHPRFVWAASLGAPGVWRARECPVLNLPAPGLTLASLGSVLSVPNTDPAHVISSRYIIRYLLPTRRTRRSPERFDEALGLGPVTRKPLYHPSFLHPLCACIPLVLPITLIYIMCSTIRAAAGAATARAS